MRAVTGNFCLLYLFCKEESITVAGSKDWKPKSTVKIESSPDVPFLPEKGVESKSHSHAKSVYFTVLGRNEEMFEPL